MQYDIVTRLRLMGNHSVLLPLAVTRFDALEAADEIEKLRAELKKTHAHYAHLLMQFVSEANAARRSTAPTPANTGGGAENQIPEAL